MNKIKKNRTCENEFPLDPEKYKELFEVWCKADVIEDFNIRTKVKISKKISSEDTITIYPFRLLKENKE